MRRNGRKCRAKHFLKIELRSRVPALTAPFLMGAAHISRRKEVKNKQNIDPDAPAVIEVMPAPEPDGIAEPIPDVSPAAKTDEDQAPAGLGPIGAAETAPKIVPI
jgi:hypothetical protein